MNIFQTFSHDFFHYVFFTIATSIFLFNTGDDNFYVMLTVNLRYDKKRSMKYAAEIGSRERIMSPARKEIALKDGRFRDMASHSHDLFNIQSVEAIYHE